MEQITQTQQTLHRLRLQVGESTILPIVIPLFTSPNQYPSRVTERNGDAQLLWEAGEERNNFERLCITLSRRTLSLTIALDHQHANSPQALPLASRNRETAVRTSMVIDARTHALYESNRSNGVLTGAHYNHEAIERFMPELTHTMATIGLYGYNQDARREVG